MSTLLSSEAVFDEKAAECGLTVAAINEMKRQNIHDLGTLAFSAGQPGQVATDDMLSRLVTIGALLLQSVCLAQFVDWFSLHNH